MFHRSSRPALSVLLCIIATIPTLAAPDLLDPAAIGSAKRPPAETSDSAESPGYARGMASSVVSSLDSLTRYAADLLERIAKLEARLRDLERQYAELSAKKAAEMEDYRNGLFCSGCNRTRTDILAHGETFPHPDQHVIQATPEQIAAKERELQAPIDQILRELAEARPKLARLKAERDEALIQIDQGFKCWQTSIVFEDILIHREAREREKILKRKADELADRTSKLRTQMLALPTDDSRRLTLAKELDKLRKEEAPLAAQRAQARRDLDARAAQAAADAAREGSLLNGFVSRGTLGLFIAPDTVANPSSGSVPGGNFSGGGLYRMGDSSPERHDETLPRVTDFLAAFFACSTEDMARAFTRRNPLAPAEPTRRQDAKEALRGLIEDLAPPEKPKTPPLNNGGSGVRD